MDGLLQARTARSHSSGCAQDSVIVGADAAGRPIAFFHPGFQTACMFAGEALCLVPFALQRWARRHSVRRAALSVDERAAARRRLHKAALAFAVPTLCDICGTTLLNTGLFFTTASAYQMLRGTLVIFAGRWMPLPLRSRLPLPFLCLALRGAGRPQGRVSGAR